MSASPPPPTARPSLVLVNPVQRVPPALAPPVARKARPGALTGELQSDILAFALLNYFSLDPRDAERVEEEYGITRGRAEMIGLRSAPSPTHVLFALAGVLDYFRGEWRPDAWPAPFYSDGEYLRMAAPPSGLLFPVWRGHFRAWLHYRSVTDAAPVWASSSYMPGGSKARASVHVVNPGYARDARACCLVSHALEAEAVAGAGSVSVAAVNRLAPGFVARELRAMWPELRAVTVDLPEPAPYVSALRAAGLAAEVAP